MKRVVILFAFVALLVGSGAVAHSAEAKPPPPQYQVPMDGGGACFMGYCCNQNNAGNVLTVYWPFPYGATKYTCRQDGNGYWYWGA